MYPATRRKRLCCRRGTNEIMAIVISRGTFCNVKVVLTAKAIGVIVVVEFRSDKREVSG